MYKYGTPTRTQLKGHSKREGEPLEHKVSRLLKNKEPIKDEAPLIYTERSEGVLAAYNIRTDRFELAAEAMDKVTKSLIAKRDSKPDEKEAKVVDLNDGKPVSEHGEQGDKTQSK